MTQVYRVTWNPDTRTARRLNHLTKVRPDVVVIQARVERYRSTTPMARDVLKRLGKQRNALTAKPFKSAAVIAQAQAWTEAQGVSDLIVTGSHVLTEFMTTLTIDFARACNARLWMVEYIERPSPPALAGVADQVTPEAFRKTWLEDQPVSRDSQDVSDPGQATPPSFPRVFDTNATSFIDDCETIGNPGFSQIKELYDEVVADLTKGLATAPGMETTLMVFRDWFYRLPCEDQVVTALRAIESVSIRSGYFLHIDIDRIRATARHEPRPALRTPEQWSALGMYANTDIGAICALIAAGLPTSEIAQLRIRSIKTERSDSTPSVQFNDQWVPVTEGGNYVKAHLRFRQILGAKNGDRLFLTQFATPLRPETFAVNAQIAMLSTGLDTLPRLPDRRFVRKWAEACGVTIDRISRDSYGPQANAAKLRPDH